MQLTHARPTMSCVHLGIKIDFYLVSANVILSHLPKSSLLQTAWTGFDPYLYSGGSSSAGPALMLIATARPFILNRGIVTDIMAPPTGTLFHYLMSLFC